MSIEVIPLGAGQEVGRSCVIVKMAGRTLMFDCGMHMGYDDQRRFPDFSYIADDSDYTSHVDCVFITHFHLDHCGALPYFTEMKGYRGPILASGPTLAILPLMLEDFRKVCVENKGEQNFFTSEMIKECCGKVTTVELHQTLTVCEDIKVTAYYAGHVLGAVMFYVECRGHSVVYTGDYNVCADRHLRGAWIERLDPNLIISESTYATKYRELKMKREKMFLKKVIQTIDQGGKVLIPVFALGRAQELCILLDTYWERARLDVPIYFAGALTGKANQFYKTFINWCNENVQRSFLKRNMFDFRHIIPYTRGVEKNRESMVLLATPGMLHGGLSLGVFKEWCEDNKNTCIIPGYCVPGTIGHTLLKSKKEVVNIDGKDYNVRCEVTSMSFSAHTDNRGIMQVLKWVNPENVVLVHGEYKRMVGLSQEVQEKLGVPCYTPSNHQNLVLTCSVPSNMQVDYEYLTELRKEHHRNFAKGLFGEATEEQAQCNLTQDWILEPQRDIFFSCEVECTLEHLKANIPEKVYQVLQVESLENKLLLTWPFEEDESVSSSIAALQSNYL